MSKILIIEDEEAIADLEKDYLELSGFEVKVANDGTEGLKLALTDDFNLVILDLMLPGTDGFEICRKVRDTKNTPIIMVSAKKDDIDKIRGLGLGADDYMTKPFSPSELVARVKAHLARYERLIGSAVEENKIIEIRGLKIDTTARRVWINGKKRILQRRNLIFSLSSQVIQIMYILRMNSSVRSGIWNRSEILPQLLCISRKFVKKWNMILQILSILRQSGEWDIALRCRKDYDYE